MFEENDNKKVKVIYGDENLKKIMENLIKDKFIEAINKCENN